MSSGIRSILFLGIITGFTCFSRHALAQECPTPVVESDGFFTIQLPTVTLKVRPGKISSELVLSQISPITGETETHRATVKLNGLDSERTALLQVNRYGFDRKNLTITGEISAVLGAGYTDSGALNIGYGAHEGGFLVLVDGENASTACLHYPENAAFGDWTDAISIIAFEPREITAAFGALKEELNTCRSQNSTLSTQGVGLATTNGALRDRVRVLEVKLARERQIAQRRIFDLSRIIRSIFNEAQAGVKTRYPGDRRALSRLRKNLVLGRKANRRNIAGSPNVVRPNRSTVNR